jgi:hypothetical protein
MSRCALATRGALWGARPNLHLTAGRADLFNLWNYSTFKKDCDRRLT